MSRRIFGSIFGGLLITAAVAVVIAPHEYWQNASWVPYREYEGEFSGRPVVMTPPSIGRPTVPLAYRIQMTSGVCQITRVDGDGNVAFRCSMGAGYVGRDSIAAGGRLQLDPGPNAGSYQLEMGLKYHLLSPFLWRSFGYGVLGVVGVIGLASLFSRRRTKAWLENLRGVFTRPQVAILAILLLFSCGILYPTLHELGHALTGIAAGGRVGELVLTPLGGDTPHVRFAQQPPEKARIWVDSAGVFLPIAVGYGLLIVWLLLGRRQSRFVQALILIPTLSLLLPYFSSTDDHLLRLARHVGCNSDATILLVKSLPAWLGAAAYAIVAWGIWQQKRRVAPSHDTRTRP